MIVNATYIIATIICFLSISLLAVELYRSWGSKTFKLVTIIMYVSGAGAYSILLAFYYFEMNKVLGCLRIIMFEIFITGRHLLTQL
jgi:hypothetical protein